MIKLIFKTKIKISIQKDFKNLKSKYCHNRFLKSSHDFDFKNNLI